MECRQAVHELDIRISRLFEKLHSDLVRCKDLDSLGDLILFTHRCPDVSVENVCALDALYIVGYFYDSASLFCDRVDLFEYLSRDLVSQHLRAVSDEVHSHLRAAVHPCIAHVVSDVSAEYDFDVLQRLVYVLLYRQHVAEDLCRVVIISKAVPYRNARILREVFDSLLAVSSVLDAVEESSEYLCRVFDRLLLSELRAVRVYECDVSSLVVRSDFE